MRTLDGGMAFDLKNILGPGIITQVNFIKINDCYFDPAEITLRTNGKDNRLTDVTPNSPLFIAFMQKGTLILHDKNCLLEGPNEIQLELISREAGLINVTVSDTLNISSLQDSN